MKNNLKMISVISIGIVLVFAVIIIALISNALEGDTPKSQSKPQQSTTETAPGSKQDNPIVVTTAELSMTGEDFAKKYEDKYIAFDGLIQGTASLRTAPKPHTQLLIGDDSGKGNFADLSLFWITSGTSTFDDSLSSYAADNDTPYDTGVYPKVHVVAKVNKFDDMYSVVQLDPIVNVDGTKPSVTQR
jgi:hypothetical protein